MTDEDGTPYAITENIPEIPNQHTLYLETLLIKMKERLQQTPAPDLEAEVTFLTAQRSPQTLENNTSLDL